jgi:phosphotransferase system enzyme I (PtsI)
VLRVLSDVIGACNIAHTPVTLCGEMAGQPRAFALLLGMGLRSFSMSPAFVPYIKEFARYLSIERTEHIVRHVMGLKTSGNIAHYVTEQLSALCPDFAKRFNYA